MSWCSVREHAVGKFDGTSESEMGRLTTRHKNTVVVQWTLVVRLFYAGHFKAICAATRAFLYAHMKLMMLFYYRCFVDMFQN